MRIKKPRLVRDARYIHRRHSIILLLITFALNSSAALWSILPDAYVNRLPPSLIFSVSGLIAILTVGLAYIRQDKLFELVNGANDGSAVE